MHHQGLPSFQGRRRGATLLMSGVLVVLLLSGCIDPMEPAEEETPEDGRGEDDASHGGEKATSGNGTSPMDGQGTDEDDEETEQGADPEDDAEGNETGDKGDGPGEDGENDEEDDGNEDGDDDPDEEEEGDPDDPQEGPVWPDPHNATLRPGVRLYTGETIQDVELHCTTNFLFRSSDGTIHLGTSASCVTGYAVGDEVPVRDLETHGTLAYSGWWDGEDHDAGHGRDFALVALGYDHHGEIHPAVYHYGGPVTATGLAGLETQDPLLWYANATQSPEGIGEGREGYVCNLTAEAAYVHPVGPVTEYDKGAGVLDGEGNAVGVISGLTPEDDTCGLGVRVEPLQDALEQARSRGMDVDLVPWTTFESGLLPPIPP